MLEPCRQNVAESRQILDNRFRAASAFLLGVCSASWIDEGVSWRTISLQSTQGERVRGRSHAAVAVCRPVNLVVWPRRLFSVIIQYSSHTPCRPCEHLGLIDSQLKIRRRFIKKNIRRSVKAESAHSSEWASVDKSQTQNHNNSNNKHRLRNVRWHCALH